MMKVIPLIPILFNFIWAIICSPTWPSSYDELEDIKYLHDGYNSRGFAFAVTPCSFTRTPGRSVAAGFLRTAFHDMAPADVAAGTGGLDASIGFELQGQYAASNGGPAFNNSMTYYSKFFNSQATISDLIALGVYTAVRGCGGPVVNTRAGRVDATQAGALGVPDVRDPGPTLQTHFKRMGLTQEESIQIVACGHTLGGVHSTEFAAIVPTNSTRLGVADFDSTNSTYDNKIIAEYLSGTTKNPLVVGPDPSARSDLRLFASDGNSTLSKLQDPTVYQQTCAKVLQKMIDTVPAGVKLTEAIEAYAVKPSSLQLNVLPGGDQLSFTGQIRVKVNDLPKADISKVEVHYKNADGSKAGTIATEALGDATGFDDSFTFYGFDTKISAKTSVSSFIVIVTLKSDETKVFDNNGKSFPVSDKIFAQTAASSLSAAAGTGVQKLKIVAAVRNGQSPTDLALTVTTINPLTYNHLPNLSKSSITLVKSCESKYYTFYTASTDVFTTQVNGTKYDVSFSSGGVTYSDSFKSIKSLPNTANALPCDNSGTSSSTFSTTTSTVKTTSATTVITSRTTKASTTTVSTSTTESTSYTTTVVTQYTTFCPFSTHFTQGNQVFTVTEATTLTITNCPCTISFPVLHPPSGTDSAVLSSSAGTSVQTTSPSASKTDTPSQTSVPTVEHHDVASTVTPLSTGTTTKPAAVATFTGAAEKIKAVRSMMIMMGLGALALTRFTL